MDLEEQQSLIPSISKPNKPVRKVSYSKSPWLNYLVLLLALVILALMSIIVIDITGYEIMHFSFKKNNKLKLSEPDTEQKQIQDKKNAETDDATDYSTQLDNLVWDEKNNNLQKNEESDQQEQQEQQNQQTVENQQVEENQISEEELQFLFDDENQQFQSATLDIVEDQNNQEALDQAEILNDDQQLEQYSLIQSGSNIIIPKIDSQTYNYAELPNKMKVLLIQNEDSNGEISLSHFQGFWDTNYYIKCEQCKITVNEHQTQYLIQTKTDKIIDELNSLSKLVAAEEPKLKQINQEQSQWQQLLQEIAIENHPASIKQADKNNFLISPNQLVLIVKGQFQSETLMDSIVQSDIVLIRDKDVQEKQYSKIFDDNSKIIKWNNQKDLNSIKLIYQLQNSNELNFVDYFVSTSLQKYIINNKLGLEVKSNVLLNEDNIQLYQIQIALPFQDQMDYDQRELAYRLSKIFINFAHSLEDKLIENEDLTEYCKQMIDQLQQINNLQFDYNSNQQIDYMEVAKNLLQDSVDEALHQKYSVSIKPESFIQTLKHLQSSQNLLILVSDSQYGYSFMQLPKGSATQDLIFLTQNEIDQHESGISYSLKELTEQTKQFIEKIDDDINFEFPQINPFVPKNMDLVEETGKYNLNDNVEVNVENQIPKINAQILINSYGQQIYAQYLYERALMLFQDAIDVGYQIDVNQENKFIIQISGWSDQFNQVYKGFMEIIKEKPDEELKSQLQFKFDMLPEHLKLIQYKLESILISNYKQPQFGAIGQDYQLKINGNTNKDQANELDQMLHKTLNFKTKSKQTHIQLYNLKKQNAVYQIKTQDKWRIVANYYQFIQLEKKEEKILKTIRERIQEKAKQNRYIFEQKKVGCSQGFFIISQTSKDLESQNKKIQEFIHKTVKELSQDDQKYLEFWKNESGLITFYIDDQDRKSNLENLDEIQCK